MLLWPAGLALIFGAAYLMTRHTGSSRFGAVKSIDRLAARLPHTDGWLDGSAKLTLLVLIGCLSVCAVMLVLGALVVVHHGHVIDKPIYNFTIDHQTHFWKSMMNRFTRIGNTWTTWGAAGVAAACIATTWRRNKWLPPVAFALVVVFDHFTTLGIRHIFERPGPPNSPHGTYPSGGVERCILFYGLIAYLLWREVSGRRTTAIWAGAGVAALGFNEAYSRAYLTLHWFTDAVSGFLYGGLLLAAFIISIRLVIGPSDVAAPPAGDDIAPHLEQPEAVRATA